MPSQAGGEVPEEMRKKRRTTRQECDLPTLQHHALCKLFERTDFTAADVAELGYRRLQRVNGIGPKGLEVICAWVQAQGYSLQPGLQVRLEREESRVQRAIRLLQRLGYEIGQPRGDDESR
jgi:hypothetical protein